MAVDDSGLLGRTEAACARFMTAYLAQRFDEAVDIFLEALHGDPDGAFRHFALKAAGQLPQAVVESSRIDEVAARLDAMIADHSNIHLICPEEPGEIDRRITMRERNIEIGLPSMVLVSMGKSASIAVANIFNSGFRLPTFAYSLFNLQVIEGWARDFARGGASYTTHLDPSRETVARLKRAGVSRVIVHVRDPRQTLLSIVHHFDKYPDQLVIYREQAKDAPNLSARAMSVLPLYMSSINWVRGWLDLEGEIDILFSTFENFVKDRASFVERYLEFYGADRRHFSLDDAFGEHTGIDNHFRRGLTDEWREVFTPEDAAYLSSLLPLRAKERFGWGDADEPAASGSPTRRDRVVAWLKEVGEPGDIAARQEADRLVAAGQSIPDDLEERAARASLRDYPDQGGTLLRLWRLIVNRGGTVPEGLGIHALRSRLADLSKPLEAGMSLAERETERLQLARELAILEIFERVDAGGSVSQLLLDGTIEVPDAEGYAKLAHTLTRRQDFAGAEAAYRQAIELDPAAPASLYRSLADVIDANGRSPEALEVLQRCAERFPGDVEVLAQLGRLQTRRGDFSGAAATYRKAIDRDPDSAELRRWLADVVREAAVRDILEQAAAGRSVQQLLLEGTIDVPDAEGYIKLAHALTARQDFEGAEVAYLRAIDLDPAAPPSLYRSLADVIDANGRSQEAIEILLMLAEQSSGDVELLARLGQLQTRQGDFPAATQTYRKAVAVDSASSELRRRLADVLDADGQSNEAVEILQSLASRAPHDSELQARLGHVLIRCGDLARAETVLRAATAIDGASVIAHCDFADVLAARGRAGEAVAMLEALVARGVEDPQLQTCLDSLRQRHPAPVAPTPDLAPAVAPPPPASPPVIRGLNDLQRHLRMFEDFKPFAGFVPKGFLVDFLGCLTDANFRSMWGINPDEVGGEEAKTSLPDVTWGEGFFEAVDWFESVREARGSYTMVTLGACYGSQAVGAYLALQRLNPLPCRLVAVEAEPANFEWLKKHLRDNGIDPQQHWLINCALSDTNKPVLFPIGEAGSGVNNCFSTNNPRSREIYAANYRTHPNLPDVVHSLILEGKTGIEIAPVPGADFHTSVEFVSAVTLNDVLGPLDCVDLLESDIQQSEIVVFPPAMDVIKNKVKRVHLGTHGAEVHAQLLQEFIDRDFEIVFDYPPNSEYQTPWGSFSINDGVITARNARLLPPRG